MENKYELLQNGTNKMKKKNIKYKYKKKNLQ